MQSAECWLKWERQSKWRERRVKLVEANVIDYETSKDKVFLCVKLDGELTRGGSHQHHVDPGRGERWQEHPLFGDQGQESSILVGQSEEAL